MARSSPDAGSDPPKRGKVGHLLRQSTGAAVDASRMRLDVLLTELVDRAGEVLETQGRLRGLLDAVVTIGGDLTLSAMLERIVGAACELVDARYGALGVLSADGTGLSDFITVGLEDAEREAIGALPSGRGILGALIEDPRPLNLQDLSQDPRSHGFPANHPPMSTFLGVPVRTRNHVFGNLYLTEKRNHLGFTEEDEHLVVALASAAGAAIQNAQLYDGQQRRGAWLTASSEIRSAALGRLPPAVLAQRVVDEVQGAAHGAFASLALVEEGGDIRIAASSEPSMAGMRLSATESVSSQVIRSGQTRILASIDEGQWTAVISKEVRERTGRCLVTPLTGGGGGDSVGTLIIGYDRDHDRYVEVDLEFVIGFAGQVAVALELAERQQDRERIAVLEDRDRIARDLHDLVIQRLFAAGMTLQSAAPLIGNETASARLEAVADDLDATIRDLRQAIYQLQTPVLADDFRQEVQQLVDRSTDGATAKVRVHFSGAVGSQVPDELRPQLLAVLREALSNAVRHSKAGTIDVVVAVDDDRVVASVSDDGVGIDPADGRRSGLANLATRAEEFGGELRIGSGERGAGTRLEWAVPL